MTLRDKQGYQAIWHTEFRIRRCRRNCIGYEVPSEGLTLLMEVKGRAQGRISLHVLYVVDIGC
jgi:hypothetical protein